MEDDDRVAVPLVEGLRREGHAVTHARTVHDALVRFRSDDPDFVLLDLGLPDGDGLDVCRLIRADSSVPLIMLTARDTEAARVEGLELGADDYVVKPFGLRELVARMRAVGRRIGPSSQTRDAATISGPNGVLTIDHRTGTVAIDGSPIELTRLFLKWRKDTGRERTPAQVVMVNTPGSMIPLQANPLYCTSKAGLRMFTQILRKQIASTGVAVTDIYPPAIATGLTPDLSPSNDTSGGAVLIESGIRSVEGILRQDDLVFAHPGVDQMYAVFAPHYDEAILDGINATVLRADGWNRG